MTKHVIKEMDLNGRRLKLETGILAQQADSAVVATWGETVVLCTVATKPTTEAVDYFPLSVEYVEKYYAGGRITAQKFIKRESRPSDAAVLSGRLIDRSIRPLFPKDFHNEVQLIITVLSFDGINDPVTLGFIGSSAAIAASSVPWFGPVAATRVGIKNGQQVLNPTLPEYDDLELDVFVSASKDKVTMIETEAREIDDETVFKAIKDSHQASQAVIKLIEEFVKECGKEKQSYSAVADVVEETVLKEAQSEIKTRVETALSDTEHPWHEATGDMIKTELAEKHKEMLTPQMISGIFDKVAKEIMHEMILGQDKRPDKRELDQVREITILTGLLPRTHGSAVFQRGGTQVLSITTLGPLSASQTLEGMTGEQTKRFMHHYNMGINPFSVGEVKKIGSPNRRDIGHGALVEKSLVNVLPTEEEFPYAIRVVSEVMAANASTSMASVCATTLALLNAGVNLQNPVAGIAMGLFSDEKKFQVITDMQAIEDFYGEMDFKVAGTSKGITAIQMDTKLQGLTFEIIEEALKQGRKARLFILDEITKALPEAANLSRYAPKIETTKIKPEDIGALIGPGGKTINAIIARNGTQIDVEEDGTVMVSAVDEQAVKKTLAEIEGMFKTVEIGEVFEGRVTKIASFGAFVEIAPGREGLVHVSQMAPFRVEKPEDVVSEGQIVKVRVTEVKEGKIGLSMLFGEDRKPETEGRPSGNGGRFGGRGRFERRDGGRGFSGGNRRDFGRRRDR
ncbi:polyribonucleotide nucleotidyltransferase [Patescibacteria group bacterium]|nr:polyribonucleotide nucleotidyltransferase [Patescibacteria group bacterium]